MAFDSSAICARTTAGDAELAMASRGLSLGQRRVLTLLQDPVAVDEFALLHHLDPEKLARDLTRLAELRLIVLHGPAMMEQPAPPVASPEPQVAGSMAPVVIGSGTRRFPIVPLAAGATALTLAVGVWYSTRSVESTTIRPNAAVATTAVQPVAIVPKPIGATTPGSAQAAVVPPDKLVVAEPPPASTRARRDGPLPSDVRVAARPAMTVATAPERATAMPNVAAPKTIPVSEPVGAAPLQSRPGSTSVAAPSPIAVNAPPLAPVPSVAAPPLAVGASVAPPPPAAATSVAAPPPAANSASPPVAAPLREREPPVQVAAAAPSTTAARAAAPVSLKAISREPPDFPKEAIADGLRSGLVNARIHVDARGNVTNVDILGSQPPKVFDRAARRALLRWQFEPNAAGQASELEVDVKFKRD